MTTLLQLLGVSDIRDVANPAGIPINDLDFSGDWIGSGAIIHPASIPGPIAGGGLAGELLDDGAAGRHYVERLMNVYAGRSYHFSLTLNIARHRQQSNGSARGVGFFVVGAPFAPSAADSAPGPGLLMAAQFDGDPDTEEGPPSWGNTSLNIVPEFQPMAGLWGRGGFSARAVEDGVVGVRLYINGQNSGNFALDYDASADPIVTGFGVAECRVVDITGSPFFS